ncbi:MAG: hypothetical protein HQL96_01830 [Magnetococcales bacterium]|nr:hypothetical protein [Magnetococcales bacterium]
MDVPDDILDDLLARSDLNPELVYGLLRLAYDFYPILDQHGNKTAYEMEIRRRIDHAMPNTSSN